MESKSRQQSLLLLSSYSTRFTPEGKAETQHRDDRQEMIIPRPRITIAQWEISYNQRPRRNRAEYRQRKQHK